MPHSALAPDSYPSYNTPPCEAPISFTLSPPQNAWNTLPIQSRNPHGRTGQRDESDGYDAIHDRRGVRSVAGNAREVRTARLARLDEPAKSPVPHVSRFARVSHVARTAPRGLTLPSALCRMPKGSVLASFCVRDIYRAWPCIPIYGLPSSSPSRMSETILFP